MSRSGVGPTPALRAGMLSLYLQRLCFFTANIQEAQELTGQEGVHQHPWDEEFQLYSVVIFSQTLPDHYLEQLGSVFLGCVEALDANENDVGSGRRDRSIVRSYFRNAAAAVSSTVGVSIEPCWEDPANQSPTTPGVVRFDMLAAQVTKAGLARQRRAAESVLRQVECLLIPVEESRMRWIQMLSSGADVADVADVAGYSERTMYRHLKQLWNDLDVGGPQQAIALSVRNRWI